MILEFTSEAEGDLEQIADYIAEHNPRRALSFIRELRTRCEDLILHPNSFALVPRYEQHRIRRRVHGNYLNLPTHRFLNKQAHISAFPLARTRLHLSTQ